MRGIPPQRYAPHGIAPMLCARTSPQSRDCVRVLSLRLDASPSIGCNEIFMQSQTSLDDLCRHVWRYARPQKPAVHVESPAAIRAVCTALGLETSSFALCATEDKSSRPSRRIRRALSGSTCPPATNAASAAHEKTRNPLGGCGGHSPRARFFSAYPKAVVEQWSN